MNKVIFIGAGPGEPELITVKGKRLLESAKVILYTGSLVPKEVLSWVPESCLIESSENMTYEQIFDFLVNHVKNSDVIRLHTGDPSIYSTIAKQIEFLKTKNIPYEIVPGITAAFAASAALGIEYTIPGVSQSFIISRIEGNTPNPESLEALLACKSSSFAFYLSVSLIEALQDAVKKLGYANNTPCWVIEKASRPDETIIKGTIANIKEKVEGAGIKRTALILFGEFLHQKEKTISHLYNVLPGNYQK